MGGMGPPGKAPPGGGKGMPGNGGGIPVYELAYCATLERGEKGAYRLDLEVQMVVELLLRLISYWCIP